MNNLYFKVTFSFTTSISIIHQTAEQELILLQDSTRRLPSTMRYKLVGNYVIHIVIILKIVILLEEMEHCADSYQVWGQMLGSFDFCMQV